ncbi:hypothetical protein ACJX0J_040233 [Zea mays]
MVGSLPQGSTISPPGGSSFVRRLTGATVIFAINCFEEAFIDDNFPSWLQKLAQSTKCLYFGMVKCVPGIQQRMDEGNLRFVGMLNYTKNINFLQRIRLIIITSIHT